MKIFFALIFMLAGVFYFQPSLLKWFPIPMSASYEKTQIEKQIAQCQENAIAYVNQKVEDRMGLAVLDFKNLIENKKFQQNFCECHGEIVRFTNLIPSDFLPSPIRKKAFRGIASEIENHLQSDEGKEQVQYCFYSAWTKVAFSY